MFPKEIKYVLVYTLEMNFCTLKKLQGSLHSRKIKPDFNILNRLAWTRQLSLHLKLVFISKCLRQELFCSLGKHKLVAHKEVWRCERVHSVFVLPMVHVGCHTFISPLPSVILRSPDWAFLHYWEKLTWADPGTQPPSSLCKRLQTWCSRSNLFTCFLTFSSLFFFLESFFVLTYFSCPRDPASSSMRSFCHD